MNLNLKLFKNVDEIRWCKNHFILITDTYKKYITIYVYINNKINARLDSGTLPCLLTQCAAVIVSLNRWARLSLPLPLCLHVCVSLSQYEGRCWIREKGPPLLGSWRGEKARARARTRSHTHRHTFRPCESGGGDLNIKGKHCGRATSFCSEEPAS